MLPVAAALAFLVVVSAAGIVALRRLAPVLTSVEHVAYGAPLGAVLASLALLLLARLFGLATATVVVGSLALAGAVLGSIRLAEAPMRPTAAVKRGFSLLRRPSVFIPVTVIALIVIRWSVFWAGALAYTDDGLVAMHVNVFGDLPVHLGNATSFAFGDNFPPEHPRFAGEPLAYHHLSDLTAAALIPLGMDPGGALLLHSAVYSVLTALAIVAFAMRITGSLPIAALAFVLFVVGGSLAWTVMADALVSSPDPLAGRLWTFELMEPAGYRWQNIFYGFLMPQRAFLYGIPLAFLSLTLLLVGIRRSSTTAFVVAGAVLGLLPLAHLATMLALAIVTPFLVLLFPRREWAYFFAAWVLVALPQLFLQQGGGPGALSALRIQLGWVAGDVAWPIFWLKQVGLLLPLLIVALAMPRLFPRETYRLLLAFMSIFVVANVIVFQPWDWDNHKVLVYWYFAACVLVAALLVWAWQRFGIVVRSGIVIGAATMLLSGVLEDVNQLLGRDPYLLFTPEEIAFAAQVRDETPPDATFATGTQNNHPVPVLAGRRALMGYAGWLFAEGLPYPQREAELREIYAYSDAAPDLLERHGVEYVVIGPVERETMGADAEAFRQRYDVAISAGGYEVFAIEP